MFSHCSIGLPVLRQLHSHPQFPCNRVYPNGCEDIVDSGLTIGGQEAQNLVAFKDLCAEETIEAQQELSTLTRASKAPCLVPRPLFLSWSNCFRSRGTSKKDTSPKQVVRQQYREGLGKSRTGTGQQSTLIKLLH
ncbi:hypothetical protein ACROYT_G019262 [Oculina patagonica]